MFGLWSVQEPLYKLIDQDGNAHNVSYDEYTRLKNAVYKEMRSDEQAAVRRRDVFNTLDKLGIVERCIKNSEDRSEIYEKLEDHMSRMHHVLFGAYL